jgi:hypothetical protein
MAPIQSPNPDSECLGRRSALLRECSPAPIDQDCQRALRGSVAGAVNGGCGPRACTDQIPPLNDESPTTRAVRFRRNFITSLTLTPIASHPEPSSSSYDSCENLLAIDFLCPPLAMRSTKVTTVHHCGSPDRAYIGASWLYQSRFAYKNTGLTKPIDFIN